MKVTLQYETQLKRAVGTAAETFDVPADAGAADVIRAAAEKHGENIAALLLDEGGQVRSSVLIFVGDEQVSPDDARPLCEGSSITLMSPISGG